MIIIYHSVFYISKSLNTVINFVLFCYPENDSYVRKLVVMEAGRGAGSSRAAILWLQGTISSDSWSEGQKPISSSSE